MHNIMIFLFTFSISIIFLVIIYRVHATKNKNNKKNYHKNIRKGISCSTSKQSLLPRVCILQNGTALSSLMEYQEHTIYS